MPNNIVLFEHLSRLNKMQFVDIFFDEFGQSYSNEKNAQKYKSLFSQSFSPQNAYAYVQNGTVLGILLLTTKRTCGFQINEEVAIEIFGKLKGKMLCKQTNMLFQNKSTVSENDLYIDVLGVSKDARNQGIASKLLKFTFSLPDFNTYYIEVLSKNLSAIRLYKTIGFLEYQKSPFSISRLFGYGYPIKMVKEK